MNFQTRALWLLALLAGGCQTVDPHASLTLNSDSGCAECHSGAYRSAAFDHASVGFGQDCARCHLETEWAPKPQAEHAAFPLIGAHGTAACAKCHAAGRADPQPTDCVGCHAAQRDAAVPDHTGFGSGCEACHTPLRWRPAGFPQHERFYPLTGAHTQLECAKCHQSGVYRGTPRECAGCHIEDRAGVRPDHEGFDLDCTRCHTDASWRPAAFPQHDTVFPLLGAHRGATCDDCHADATFERPPRTCVQCHGAQRAGVDPNHDGFPEACEACHTEQAWRPATFTNHDAVFPLRDAHAQVDCAQCHLNDRFRGTPRDCAGCHLAAREAAPVDHTGFPDNCDACHTERAWRPANFDGHEAVFPRVGAHAAVACEGCHINNRYLGTPRACEGCHLAARDAAQVDHSNFPNPCDTCHTAVAWRPADFSGHDQLYPRVGAHRGIPCERCHVDNVYTGTARECVGCHLQAARSAEPDHSRFPNGCQVCHSQARWSPSDFTGHGDIYPLTGAHAQANCERCHVNHVYRGTPRTCVGCHLANRDAAGQDHSAFPDSCQNCHGTAAWRPVDYAGHAAVYPLEGRHADTACGGCHVNNIYRGTPRRCEECHLQARADANHDHSRYPDGCAICHTPARWRPSTYQGHDPVFPLNGAHAEADCAACHIDDVFRGTANECVRCHGDQRQGIQPDHANLPDTCETCHSDTGWRPADFAGHDAVYPLVGGHRGLDCAACHQNGVYRGTTRQCVGCHRAARDAAVPDHSGLPDTCETCHDPRHWRPSNFAGHDAIYPLEGAHAAADCTSCHVNGVYSGTPRACEICHADARARVRVPDHTQFPPACSACHNTTGWAPADFSGHDHEAIFPLVGSHRGVDCAQCHVNNVYSGTPRTCVGCHAAQRAAANPSHNGFPDDCTTCHGVVRWRPADFAGHDAIFRLVGAHAVAQCTACHVNQVYRGTPRTCVGCHASQRDRANPSHNGFPDDCASCHGNVTWRPANFNHDRFYRLQGAHVRASCAGCHVNGVYAGTSRTCIGCHRAQRAAARTSHAGFPDDCTRCHTQNNWAGAHYQHRRFRVPHRGVSRCDQCHLNANNYAAQSCIHCHAHTQARMAGEHRGRRGYSWTSAACLRCHPAGRED